MGGTQRMKLSLGRCEMHMRQVKCEGGGARGLGFLVTLRLGYHGSRRLRRFVVFFEPLLGLPGWFGVVWTDLEA